MNGESVSKTTEAQGGGIGHDTYMMYRRVIKLRTSNRIFHMSIYLCTQN